MTITDYCKTAEHFGILPQIEKLTHDLLQVRGVIDVEYDLDGFWSNIREVIILAKYDIAVDDSYYPNRREALNGILAVCEANGLTRTGDTIEDYGEHYYIVTSCLWPVKEEI